MRCGGKRVDREKNIIDVFYQNVEAAFDCKAIDEFFGKRYVVGKQFGIGNFSRMKIEDGIEVSKFRMNKTNLYFDNRQYEENMLQIGYCYSGTGKITSLPDNKEYILKENDCFFYKFLNDVQYFKFTYDNCKTISIHMNLGQIKNVVNPIWEDKIIADWQNTINHIFKEEILIIQKAGCQMKKIAEQIDVIPMDSIMDYMKLKLKTLEFLDVFLQENSRRNFLYHTQSREEKIFLQAQAIIRDHIGDPLSVKKISNILNISLYKLQETFKAFTDDTVYEYIKKAKLEKAKYLLRTTDMSILKIVNEVGYENPSKFANLFRIYNNITPLKYRKNCPQAEHR